MEFQDGDIVVLTGKPRSSETISIGTRGEVIEVYPGRWYEVLFYRPNGRPITSAAVDAENLTLVKRMQQTA